MAIDKSLGARLQRLFSNNVIVRRVGGKKLRVLDTDNLQSVGNLESTKYVDRYTRLHGLKSTLTTSNNNYNYQGSRTELYTDYECLAGSTIIPTPDKTANRTIAELSELYPNSDTKFYVYSYDKESDSIKLGMAHSVRRTKTDQTYKIIFDNNQELVATAEHPIMMRNGEYKQVKDIIPGESVMPLYIKDFYGEGYNHVYNFKNGWQTIHRMVAEQFDKQIEKHEVVHHIDFNKNNNLPDNLQIMTREDHNRYHREIINKDIIWSEANRAKQCAAISAGIQRFHASDKGLQMRNKMSEDRNGVGNPFYGKTHSITSNDKRSSTIKQMYVDGKIERLSGTKNPNYNKGYVKQWISKYGQERADIMLAEHSAKMSAKIGKLHPKYVDIPIDLIKTTATNVYLNSGHVSATAISNELNFGVHLVRSRIREAGYTTCNEFCSDIKSTLNHKVVSIEKYEILDVYDMTVDTYHNFATDTCFVHNCMDQDSIISSALDIYADEISVRNEYDEILTVKSSDENIKKILHNLFYDILNIEFNLWPWVRNMMKYGDFYLYLDIRDEIGIVNVTPMSSYEMVRVEGTAENPYEVRFSMMGGSGLGTRGRGDFENYQVAHFRLLSDANFLPYGKSILEGARKTWKQLTMLEDAMLINRVMRAPERRIFKVDVGNIPPNEVDNYMQQLMSKMKKTPYLNEQTGDYDLKFNLMNMLEDYYLPVRGGNSGTDISTLEGIQFTGIDDINYLKNRMLAALKVPKAFLTFDDAIGGKAVLATEDIRFARTVERVQRIIISELTKIAVIHLFAQGYDNEDLINFDLGLTTPSIVYEQEKVELQKGKSELVAALQESKLLSEDWIYKHIYKLSEDEIANEREQVIEDAKNRFRVKQIEDEGNDPVTTGESFGTAHDIASLHVKLKNGYMDTQQPVVPDGGWPGAGRPKSLGTNYKTDDGALGRDPVGAKAAKKLQEISKEQLLRQLGLNSIKGKQMILESIKPKVNRTDAGTFLDEENLLK